MNKLKLLLTICLLLITSQVFAKKITLYNCPTEADARSCNNCKKNSVVKVANVKVKTNKVLMQFINYSGEPIMNDYLKTVKHEDEWIGKNTNFATLITEKETLDVFDEDNWEYLNVRNHFYTRSNQIETLWEKKESMVNGKYYKMSMFRDSPPTYSCGK